MLQDFSDNNENRDQKDINSELVNEKLKDLVHYIKSLENRTKEFDNYFWTEVNDVLDNFMILIKQRIFIDNNLEIARKEGNNNLIEQCLGNLSQLSKKIEDANLLINTVLNGYDYKRKKFIAEIEGLINKSKEIKDFAKGFGLKLRYSALKNVRNTRVSARGQVKKAYRELSKIDETIEAKLKKEEAPKFQMESKTFL